jgi:outer membrane lipoprotein-sorting protein
LRKYLLYLFLLPLAAIAACSGSSQEETLNKIPIKAIKEKVNSNSSSIETLEAYGVISFDSPENSGTGNILIKIKKPDSVYVKIEGPFGISIAAALITRQDFIYYNIQENKVITGPSSDLNIGAILRIRVSFDELINSFTGSFHFKDDSADSTEAASESSMYVLQVNGAKGIEKYFVEPSFYTIQQYRLLDKEMKSKIEVVYSNYTNESTNGKSVSFPNKVFIKNVEKQQSVYLDYETKEINKKDISFRLKVPKSAKVIKWD